MNNTEFENELNFELSPEENDFVDRLLRETAEFEDEKVDYEGMLRAIKAEAKKEGIVIFPAAKKQRRASVRKVIAGLSTAAAVLAMGLAVLAIVKTNVKKTDISPEAMKGDVTEAAILPTSNADAVSPSELSSDHEPSENAYSTRNPELTSVPATEEPAPSALPVVSGSSLPDNSPLPTAAYNGEGKKDPPSDEITMPTGFPTRGGYVDYSLIAAFYAEPESTDQLIPEALPEDMPAKESPDELMVYAASPAAKDETVRFYSCRVTDERDDDLEVGVARCAVNNDGSIRMLWHASEETWLLVEFGGIELEYAEQLLTTLPLCCSPYSLEEEPAA